MTVVSLTVERAFFRMSGCITTQRDSESRCEWWEGGGDNIQQEPDAQRGGSMTLMEEAELPACYGPHRTHLTYNVFWTSNKNGFKK